MPLTLQDFVNAREDEEVSIEEFSDSDIDRINEALAELTADPTGPAAGSPTAISDWNDLVDIGNDLSGNYVLINDLDSGTAGYSGVGADDGSFSPLGQFSGTFDGQGHAIRGLNIDAGSQLTGLFNSVGSGGEVKNLTLADADVDNTEIYTGVLAGGVGGTVWNVDIKNSEVNGTAAVGGLTGLLQDGLIENVSISGTVTGTSVTIGGGTLIGAIGGLAGFVDQGGTIKQSEISATVNGEAQVGGIIGNPATGTVEVVGSKATGAVQGTELNYDGGVWANGQTVGGIAGGGVSADLTIRESYATATIRGTEKVGGLLGEAPPDLTVERSYSTADITAGEVQKENTELNAIPAKVFGGLVGSGGNVQINNSYAAITLSGPSPSEFGGVVGGGNISSVSGDDNYWDTESTGTNTAAGDSDLTVTATGLTTSQMQGSSADNNMSLDFSTEWQTQTSPDDYPTLQ